MVFNFLMCAAITIVLLGLLGLVPRPLNGPVATMGKMVRPFLIFKPDLDK